MSYAILITLGLIITTIAWHFWSLRFLYRLMPEDTEHSHFIRSTFILCLLFCVHLSEIFLFSWGTYLINEFLNVGNFTYQFQGSIEDYIYFSTISYTTLGLSNFQPEGYIRLLAALESLTGFIMLTWSATFFYSLSSRNYNN